MAGVRDLDVLLRSLAPALDATPYVFTTIATTTAPAGAHPVATVHEDEGLTLVLPRAEADRLGLSYEYIAARITLRVHSALDAVGLTAAVATCLAEAGISCNVVAGYHHDHLFVPHERAAAALAALARLAG